MAGKTVKNGKRSKIEVVLYFLQDIEKGSPLVLRDRELEVTSIVLDCVRTIPLDFKSSYATVFFSYIAPAANDAFGISFFPLLRS